MKNYFLLFSYLLLLYSCQIDKTQRFYCSQFIEYLHEMHIDENSTEYYYAVHLQGCNSCIRSSIDFLNRLDPSIKEKTLVLFIGDYIGNDIECFKSIEILKNNVSYIEDSHQSIFNYQTVFAYPLFIEIKNGKCKMYEEMIDNKYNDPEFIKKIK